MRSQPAGPAQGRSPAGGMEAIGRLARRIRYHEGWYRTGRMGIPMNEEALNLSIRKFLKMVGISSQREIEHAVAKAAEAGAIKGTESFPATMTLEIAGLKVNVKFSGDIALQ
jgi:hypothetical protein